MVGVFYFCQVVPARGMANVNFSFTPFPTEEVVRDMDCNGYALGYMSLDKVMLSPLKLLTFVSDYLMNGHRLSAENVYNTGIPFLVQLILI